MDKFVYAVITIILAVSLTITVVLTSIQLVAFNQGFYIKEFQKYQRAAATGIAENELIKIAQAFMAYLKGERADLNISATVNGVEMELFNKKELQHMEDVRALFFKGFALRLWAIVIGAACLLAIILMKKRRKEIAATLIWASGISLASGALVGMLLALDFDRWFIYFHLMFFDNDLWQLNPDTDMLINIFNEGFFSDAAFHILLYSVSFITAILIGSALWLKAKRGAAVQSR